MYRREVRRSSAECLLCFRCVLAKRPFAFPYSGTGRKYSFSALQANLGAWWGRGGYVKCHIGSLVSAATPSPPVTAAPSPPLCISYTRKGTGLVQRSSFCSLHVPGSDRLGGALATEQAPHWHPVVPEEMRPSSCPGRVGAQCHQMLWGGTGRIWGKAGPSPPPATLPTHPCPAQQAASAGVGMVSPQWSQSSSCSPVARSRS